MRRKIMVLSNSFLNIKRSLHIWFSYIYSNWFITLLVSYEPTEWPAPRVGLLAQLSEHCTGIADVTGSKPVRFQTHFLSRSSHIWFSYIYSQFYSFSIKRVGLMTHNEKTGFCKESLDCFLIWFSDFSSAWLFWFSS